MRTAHFQSSLIKILSWLTQSNTVSGQGSAAPRTVLPTIGSQTQVLTCRNGMLFEGGVKTQIIARRAGCKFLVVLVSVERLGRPLLAFLTFSDEARCSTASRPAASNASVGLLAPNSWARTQWKIRAWCRSTNQSLTQKTGTRSSRTSKPAHRNKQKTWFSRK